MNVRGREWVRSFAVGRLSCALCQAADGPRYLE
jgi:hypothetical protein